jgi:hypothetical protein
MIFFGRDSEECGLFSVFISLVLSLALAIVLAVFLGIFIFIGYEIHRAYAWHKAETVWVQATLLHRGYMQEMNTHVQRVGSKNRMTTIHQPERNMTVWVTEGYGIVTSDNQKVFRLSEEESTLGIRQVGDEVRVWDISSSSRSLIIGSTS